MTPRLTRDLPPTRDPHDPRSLSPLSRRAAKPPKPTDLVHSSLVIKEGSTPAVNVDYTAAEVSPATVKHLTADDTNPDVVPNKFGEAQFQLFS